MGKKKIFIIFAVVILLLIGWLLAFKSVTRIDEIKKQNNLVKKADAFMERELYVRAIPLYEEAVGIDTSKNAKYEIENKLLVAYYNYGDNEKYTNLVEKRVKADRATAEEMTTAALFYIEENSMKNAFAIMKKGIEKYPDSELKTLYEDYRYEYRKRSTKFTEVLPTIDNSIMPAFDGEKWGYIARDGSTVIPARYDKVTAFTDDGIAAVSLDGQFYTINTRGDKYGRDDEPNVSRIQDLAYSFSNLFEAKKDEKYGFYDYDFNPVLKDVQFDELTRCSNNVFAARNGSGWEIRDASDGSLVLGDIEDVAINSYGSVFNAGRGMVKISGEWFLINTEGQKIVSTPFKDARAPESGGYIAVADDIGMWGFINEQGELVIDYQYYDAFSFSDNVAAVQIYDEKWQYISALNVPISEEEFDAAKPFHGGTAQISEEGMAGLLMFTYYEE